MILFAEKQLLPGVRVTSGFLMFSGGIERDPWNKMD